MVFTYFPQNPSFIYAIFSKKERARFPDNAEFIDNFAERQIYRMNAKNKMLWKYVEKTFRTKKYISPCSAGSLIGVIYHNGSVFPCERRNQEIGKLKDFDYNFLKCWHSQKAKEIQKEIITSKCNCTNECFWLLNIFSSPRYYPELSYQIIRNLTRKNG